MKIGNINKIILVCILDRVNDIFKARDYELNSSHQSMVVILSTYATRVFTKLSSLSKGENSKITERYERLAALASNLKYLSSLTSNNTLNRNPRPDPVLVNHIKKYVSLLKAKLIEEKLFKKVGSYISYILKLNVSVTKIAVRPVNCLFCAVIVQVSCVYTISRPPAGDCCRCCRL